MSHPLGHSDLLRIIEEYLASELTKYATEKKYGLYQVALPIGFVHLGSMTSPKAKTSW